MRTLRFLCISTLLTVLVGCVSPIQTPEEVSRNNDLLATQILQLKSKSSETIQNNVLDNTLTLQRASGIYFGLALDGISPAFEGDIKRVQSLFFDKIAKGPSLLLSNSETNKQIYPRADFRTMPEAAKAIGDYTVETDVGSVAPSLKVVVVSSHGRNKHMQLRVGKYRIQGEVSDAYLLKLLDNIDGTGKTPLLLIISACHSGSFIPLLAAPNRIIMTAAASGKLSFGCGTDSKNTAFTEYLLDQNIDTKLSLRRIFDDTLQRIIDFELKMKIAASSPQISVGKDMQNLYEAPIEKWHDILNKEKINSNANN